MVVKNSVDSSAVTSQEDSPDVSVSSNDKSEPLLTSETDDSSVSVLVMESADDTDAEGSKISSESKSIQTDETEQAFEDQVEIFAVPASSIYPKLEVC